ncbi:MAG: thiol-disulfide oxidoreductase DCC family protein [Haliscomenobacter sp.]|nr:thiol-disulfide oxidoreductase DCC family protein [Haliscomenobacter sp.]MBK8878283.1 thiol-disulfide oxidoreductase DCC family protein [Haliscomenobacter sp.]
MNDSQNLTGPILLFDGVCNLCNGTVQFILRVDRKQVFRFASLQSEIGQQLLRTAAYDGPPLDSVVLIKDQKAFIHSEAVLEIARLLGGGWALLYGFSVIPKGWRDRLYSWIAQNRYRWFGKKEQCMIPSPKLRARFL